MARRRERPGLRPQMIAMARGHIRGGAEPSYVVSLLAEEFTGVSLNQIRGIVDREGIIWNTTQTLRSLNRGMFVNVAKSAGCYNQAGSVNLRIALHYTDPVTGDPTTFTHSSIVSGIMRWGQMLDTAINEIRMVALDRHYEIPVINSSMRDGPVRWELVAAECIE